MTSVKIVADSINSAGNRIVSMECTYQRYIHSELLTHRAFARNAASSRAIPVATMLASIQDDPAMPFHWGKTQKGMVAERELNEDEKGMANRAWLAARDDAVIHAKAMLDLGLHKQIANRILEPWAHMTTLITATEWGNFFNLRCEKSAHPDFQRLAWLMLKRYHESHPEPKKNDEWHLPYGDRYMPEGLSLEKLIEISTARSARTSYLTMNKEIAHDKDYELHQSLKTNHHMSPFEHAAYASPGLVSGPYVGWVQYRKTITGENQEKLDAKALLDACPFRDWLEAQ